MYSAILLSIPDHYYTVCMYSLIGICVSFIVAYYFDHSKIKYKPLIYQLFYVSIFAGLVQIIVFVYLIIVTYHITPETVQSMLSNCIGKLSELLTENSSCHMVTRREPMDIHDPHGTLNEPFNILANTHQPAATNLADRLAEQRALTKGTFPGNSANWYMGFLYEWSIDSYKIAILKTDLGEPMYNMDGSPKIDYCKLRNNFHIRAGLRLLD